MPRIFFSAKNTLLSVLFDEYCTNEQVQNDLNQSIAQIYSQTRSTVNDCSKFDVKLANNLTMRLDQVTFIPFDNTLFTGNSATNPFILNLRAGPVDSEEYKFRGMPAHQLRNIIDSEFRLNTGWETRIVQLSNDSESNTVLVWNAQTMVRRSFVVTLFGVVNWEFLEMFRVHSQQVLEYYNSINRFTLQHCFNSETAVEIMLQDVDQRLLPISLGNVSGHNTQLAKELTKLDNLIYLPNSNTRDLFVFDRILEAIVKFRSSLEGKGESQFVSLLWCPILCASITDRIADIAYPLTEYASKNIDKQLETQYVDFVVCKLKRSEIALQQLPPTFFAEAAHHGLCDEMSAGKGFMHKDFCKMVKVMRASISYYWGVFSHKPHVQSKLCVYGAFLAGSQIQYCVMRPIISDSSNSDSFSVLFQTHLHWRNDLSGSDGSSCIDGEHCELGICSQFPTLIKDIKVGDKLSNVTFQMNNRDSDKAVNDEDAEHSSGKSDDDSNSLPGQEGLDVNSSLQIVSKRILSMISFGKIVAANERWLYEEMRLLNEPSAPVVYPASIAQKVITTSSGSHDSKSPNKVKETPIKRPSGQAQTSVTLYELKNGMKCVTIVKTGKDQRVIKNEIDFLLQLSSCRNVVDLLAYQWHSEHPINDSYWEMTQEYLTVFPEDGWKYYRAQQAFPVACQFLLDGVEALQALREHGIVHRDISPSNYLYSARDCCFKLLDFEFAVRLEPGQDCYPLLQCDTISTCGPVGTRGFIATELFDGGAAYSWRTDLYSLGASFCHQWLGEVVEYNGVSADFGFEEINEGIDQQFHQIVSHSITAKCPADRSTLEELKKDLLQLYYSIRQHYSHLPDYRVSRYDCVVVAVLDLLQK